MRTLLFMLIICYKAFSQHPIETEIRRVLEKEEIQPYVIELLVAQSKHESANYTNNLTRYNNVFARHYQKSDTFATSGGAAGEGHTRFAKYPSVEAATLSQLWYFRSRGYSLKWVSVYEFARECKRRGYYTAPLSVYIRSMDRFMKK